MHPNGVSGAGWITLWVSVLALSALAGVSILPRAAAQQKIIIRFGHVGFPDSLFESTGEELPKRGKKEHPCRALARVFHPSQPGTDEAMFRGVSTEAFEMCRPA